MKEVNISIFFNWILGHAPRFVATKQTYAQLKIKYISPLNENLILRQAQTTETQPVITHLTV